MVLSYQHNELKAFDVPGLADKVVQKYPPLSELELGMCKQEE